MRVLVTRAEADAARTAGALARLGHEAVIAPALAIAPRPFHLRARRPDALLATSRHAFAAPLPEAIGRGAPVFAVGERTAEAARAAGYRDVRVGAGDGAGLASLVALTLPRPATLVYLAGRDRKAEVEAALAAAGYRVEVAEVYAAEPIGAWPAAAVEALRAGAVAAALHYSRRSATLALNLARRHGVIAPFLSLEHLCLSADAAEALVAAGAPAAATAARADEGSLLALLRNP